MSVEFIIDYTFNWHFGEAKEIAIRVLDADGNPVDLENKDLRWAVARAANSTNPYLELTTGGGTVVIEAHDADEGGVMSVARMLVTEADYDAFPRHGRFRHELRDQTDGLVLSRGPVTLLPAMSIASS